MTLVSMKSILISLYGAQWFSVQSGYQSFFTAAGCHYVGPLLQPCSHVMHFSYKIKMIAIYIFYHRFLHQGPLNWQTKPWIPICDFVLENKLSPFCWGGLGLGLGSLDPTLRTTSLMNDFSSILEQLWWPNTTGWFVRSWQTDVAAAGWCSPSRLLF